MKKVLIIHHAFPPYRKNVGGIIRVAALANFLVKNECKVHVLTIKYKKTGPSLINMDDRIVIHTKPTLLDYWLETRNKKKYISKACSIIRSFLISRLEKNKIDKHQLSVNTLYRKAIKIINKYNINNVIISYPPFSYNLIAIKLKKRFGSKINLISDFRDG